MIAPAFKEAEEEGGERGKENLYICAFMCLFICNCLFVPFVLIRCFCV